MGRTLNYTITKDGSFTREEEVEMYDVSIKYNSGPYEDVWTCENFWVDTVSYYPNWDYFKSINKGTVDAWEEVNKRYDKIEVEEDLHHIDIVRKLKEEGFVCIYNEEAKEKGEVRAFTKTQGNELNSLLVYKALLELSERCPQFKISLSDEGRFLYLPVFIKNGRVLPNIERFRDSLGYRSIRALFSFSENEKVKKVKSHFEEILPERVYNDLGFDGWERQLDYLEQDVEELAELIKRLQAVGELSDDFSIHNLNLMADRNGDDWFDPECFFRDVDIKKFLDYEMSVATMMDGFRGEGFGLADDAEGYSYRTLAKLGELFNNDGFETRVIGDDA